MTTPFYAPHDEFQAKFTMKVLDSIIETGSAMHIVSYPSFGTAFHHFDPRARIYSPQTMKRLLDSTLNKCVRETLTSF